ncbi:kinase domain protein [Dictyocaulus viviparus]|uniref:non-specific serine/threonine protein kinase n=1 Tax=Dictyocaulus viviparus TaxID=29172 RepID=A0A0D8XRX2_DICVI|nr:kinase domain protein [Dictyocaulus viviparus]
MSIYNRTLHMLASDPIYQKEVALGKRIGFYRLGKELGAGNFSKVKLGIHVLTKEKVAVKIMDRSKMDTKAQRLLEREIKSMENMHHPNIIRLFECVETLNKTYLVVEYAGGGELYAYVHERGKLENDDAKPLFAQVVAAVSHMHKNNLVHRDIKAENIMFTKPGVVKLVDFGFSCMMSSTDQQLTTFCGSPPYAAPELFRFEDQSYNGPMVDIWALGILLHFMLIGVTPFRGESVTELKASILQGIFTLPLYLEHSSRLLIESMLTMDPEKRPKIENVKKSIWLRGCRYSTTYMDLLAFEEKEEERAKEISKKVWTIMKSYGIDEEMLEESNERGPRNAVIGTYRIVQYQVESAIKKTQSESSLFQPTTPTERRFQTILIKHKSKACTIV